MITYNAVQDYQDIKLFESYLLIKQRIEHECKRGIHQTLLLLKSVYTSGGTEHDLMEVFRKTKKE
ncbi:MAG: hypothetical protein NT085_05585 [candidate division SR1 bacterium]|nr:hypothetical protein [candidate division SR1 bacterium]